MRLINHGELRAALMCSLDYSFSTVRASSRHIRSGHYRVTSMRFTMRPTYVPALRGGERSTQLRQHFRCSRATPYERWIGATRRGEKKLTSIQPRGSSTRDGAREKARRRRETAVREWLSVEISTRNTFVSRKMANFPSRDFVKPPRPFREMEHRRRFSISHQFRMRDAMALAVSKV